MISTSWLVVADLLASDPMLYDFGGSGAVNIA
jgi:hypothetical protein